MNLGSANSFSFTKLVALERIGIRMAPDFTTCGGSHLAKKSELVRARAKLGLSDTLVRLSPGCEHPKDLVADLLEGLAAVDAARASNAQLVNS